MSVEKWLHDVARPIARRCEWWALWGLLGAVLLLIADGRFRAFGEGSTGIPTALSFVALLGLLLLRMWPGRPTDAGGSTQDGLLATGAAQLTLGFALAQEMCIRDSSCFAPARCRWDTVACGWPLLSASASC